MERASIARSRERRLKERLDVLLSEHDDEARREADPVGFVHRAEDPEDQEVVALVAATLAFGNVAAIRASIRRLLGHLGPRPAKALRRATEARLKSRFEGFVHRVYRGEHMARMLANAGRLRRREGSLGAALAARVGEAGDLREGLARWADLLRGPDPDRGLKHLLPDPRAGSACKRLLLLCRWMVRPADGVDLGLWPLSPSQLVIPVDTHIQRIAQNLRLTERSDASWRTAEEITASLRRLDPEDPVKYDFALCHLGISRSCPSRRDEERCAGCSLRPVCLHWQGRRKRSG